MLSVWIEFPNSRVMLFEELTIHKPLVDYYLFEYQAKTTEFSGEEKEQLMWFAATTRIHRVYTDSYGTARVVAIVNTID